MKKENIQKIKDFWWIFIEMNVPLKEIRQLIQRQKEKELKEIERVMKQYNYKDF